MLRCKAGQGRAGNFVENISAFACRERALQMQHILEALYNQKTRYLERLRKALYKHKKKNNPAQLDYSFSPISNR